MHDWDKLQKGVDGCVQAIPSRFGALIVRSIKGTAHIVSGCYSSACYSDYHAGPPLIALETLHSQAASSSL